MRWHDQLKGCGEMKYGLDIGPNPMLKAAPLWGRECNSAIVKNFYRHGTGLFPIRGFTVVLTEPYLVIARRSVHSSSIFPMALIVLWFMQVYGQLISRPPEMFSLKNIPSSPRPASTRQEHRGSCSLDLVLLSEAIQLTRLSKGDSFT